MTHIIAISNLKGGIGKTTTVVNLGAGLALKGARVLLVDVDAQGNLAMALGAQPKRTLYDALVDGARAEDCRITVRPRLDLLPSDHTLLGAQPIIAQRADWSRALEKVLRPLVASYDFVLIDSGGSLTPLNVNAFVAAKSVVAPTTIEHFSLKSIDLLFDQVARVKGSSAGIKLIVPTMFDPRVKQSNELLADLRSRYGGLVGPPIRVNVKLSEAPRLGQTIYEYDPRSRGAVDYAMLVERICELFPFEVTAEQPVSANNRPTPHTNGYMASPEASKPIAFAQPSTAQSCPNCGSPIGHATLAGYNVAYCNNCHWTAQKLVREPRR